MLAAVIGQLGPMRVVETSAAGGAAFAMYVRGDDGRYHPASLHVPRFDGAALVELHAFLDPGLFARFGLPAVL